MSPTLTSRRLDFVKSLSSVVVKLFLEKLEVFSCTYWVPNTLKKILIVPVMKNVFGQLQQTKSTLRLKKIRYFSQTKNKFISNILK